MQDGAQIVFVDTPGIHESSTQINRRMMQTVRAALDGRGRRPVFVLRGARQHAGEPALTAVGALLVGLTVVGVVAATVAAPGPVEGTTLRRLVAALVGTTFVTVSRFVARVTV